MSTNQSWIFAYHEDDYHRNSVCHIRHRLELPKLQLHDVKLNDRKENNRQFVGFNQGKNERFIIEIIGVDIEDSIGL